MKKQLLLTFSILLFLFLFPGVSKAEINMGNENLYNNLKGKIILRVEAKGEAYYIHPDKQKMYYLGRPADAFQVMREQGIGISNDDLSKICTSSDANNDLNFADSQKGKIFLQVEENGEAWYVNPRDSRRYFLGSPANAFGLMRELGLGISENDFNKLLNKETKLKEIDGCYAKSNKHIYWVCTFDGKEKKVEEADLSTFEIIVSGGRVNVAKDKNHVFSMDQIIEGADPNSFKHIRYDFFKDKNNIYHGSNRLENIDVETFEIIIGGGRFDVFKDKNNVYYGSTLIEDADPSTFEYFPERHNLTSGSGYSYAKDKNNVYLGSEKLLNADPEAFVLMIDKGIYGKDENNAYYQSTLIEEADLNTFEVIDYHYSKDKNNVYKNGKIVEGADPDTFSPN